MYQSRLDLRAKLKIYTLRSVTHSFILLLHCSQLHNAPQRDYTTSYTSPPAKLDHEPTLSI